MVKILAIGESKNDRIVLNTLLAKSFPDAEFMSSQTGAEGIELCHTLNPDMILLDVVMPGMNGFEVCRVLKSDELTKIIPVVMITSTCADKESRIKGLKMGADAFLAKPIDESELTAQIRAMLRIKESEDRRLNENERLKKLVEERTITLQKELNERKKAEEVLRESEQRFRRISSSITDISYSCKIDSNGNSAINWLYGAASKITGYTNDELFAMKCWGKLVVDDDFPIFKKHVLNVIPGQSDTCQLRLKKKDGTLIWIQATTECVKEEHENTDAAILYGGLVDITERKFVERSLQKQKNEFETIFNLVPAQIWYKDAHNNIIRVNQQVCKDIGLTCGEIEGRATEELFPDFAQKYFEDDLEVIHSGIPKFGIIEQINTASGELKWHHTSKVPVFNEQGEATGIIAFALDITEGKIAEDVVNASRERWENLFNNSPSAIAIYQAVDDGNDFVFTDFNLTAQKTDNLKHDEVVGKRISELFPAAGELGLLDSFRRVWRTGKTEYLDSTFYKDNRIQGWRENIIYRLNTGEVVAIYNDVSDRMKAEIALRESEQRYRQLAENSPIPVVVISLEKGNFLYANQSAFNLVGDLPEGKSIQEFYVTDFYLNPELRDERMRFLMENDKISNQETKLKTFDGREIIVLISSVLTTFQDESAIFASFYDITDRKKVEVALTEKNTFIQTVLDNLPIGIALNTIDTGTALYMNKKFEEIYGWPSEEIKDVADFFGKVYPDENYRNELGTKIMTDIQSGDASRMHWENCIVTHKDDSVHIVNAVNIPLPDQNTMVSTVTDFTEMKKAEQALRHSEEKFRSIFENHSAIKLLIDPETGDIVDANEAAARYYGWSREELRQMKIQQIDTLPKEQVFSAIKKIKDQGQTHFEFRHKLKDGSIRDVEVFSSKIEIGDKVYLHSINHDVTERKKAEKELVLYNSRLELAMNSANMAWWEMDVQSGSVVFEKRKAEMLGYPPEMFKHYTDYMAIVHPDDFDKTMNAMRKHLNGEVDRYEVEYRIKSSDGRYRWFYDIGSVTKRDEENHALTVAGLVLNISERKQAELALRESQDRYRSFISQVSEGVYRFECNMPIDITLPEEEQIDLMYDHFFIDECNEAILKMYKMSDEKEMIGKGLLDFHGGRNNAVNRATLREFIRSGYRIVNAITEERNYSGQQMYISNNSLGIVENDRLIRLWGTQTDITDKVRAEQVQQVLYSISNAALSSIGLPELIEFISKEIGKLLDSTNFYIAFYDEKTDMLSTVFERDEHDVLQTWPAEHSITGYVIKKQESMLIKDSEVQKFYDQEGIKLIGTPSKVWLGVPLTINNKAIGALVVQSYDNPNAYSEKDKRMLEFISTQVSISIERKKADQEIKEALFKAQESDRLKSAFLANMSHEIRTPLNSIIGFSELMTDPDFGMEQQLHFAQMIIASGNTLLAIINDIMDISKIEAGQVQVQKEPVSISLLLKDIRKEYSYKASEKGIELKLDILNPKEEISIESDETKIRQVLINLVGNAIKFTKEGYVEIGVRIVKDKIQFHVKDTGIGIPVEFHHKIFERFRQVEDADSRRYGGNGLGLAISKSLIELLGGKIWVESEKEKGSTFYFTIPRR